MITAPVGLDLKRENVPRELKELDQWVGWRWKQIGEKWTKVPCSLQTNRAASSNDRETWSSYYETEGHENIGFMFSEDDTYCGIDLDACRNPETGEITKLARQIIDRMASYSEISPSGTGVKIFIRGVVSGLRRKNPKKKIEVYDRRRFFACTGHHLPGTPKTIEARQDVLEAFYSWLFPEEETPSLSPNGSHSEAAGLTVNHDLSDEDILSRAYRAANGDKFMKLWNGDASDYESHSEADLALCAMLAFWTGPDPERVERMFSESSLSERPKWRGRPRYRRDTVAKALDGMTEFYDQATGATLVVSKNGGVSGNGAVLPSSPAVPPEAPSFPTDAFPEAARRFVVEGAEAIGCTPDLLALPVLAVLSAGIGGSRVVQIKRSWREGATLFLAIVASPGEKKTPAANAARRPVLKRQAEKKTSHVPKCLADADSIADGHYAYDKTTGSKLAWNRPTQSYSKPYGQRVKFQKKPDPTNDPNQDPNTISYPFPTNPAPDPARLKGAALGSGTYYKALNPCSEPCNTFYKPGAPGTLLSWNDIVSNANRDKVVFIDAQNHNLTYNINSTREGIIVAWCGNLRMTNANFHGIVLAMKGDGAPLGNDGAPPVGSGGPSTDCALDDNKGVLTTDNSTLKAWLYSDNTSDTPGIQLGQNTTLFFMPGGTFNLLDVVLQDPIMTSINSKGWRELYE